MCSDHQSDGQAPLVNRSGMRKSTKLAYIKAYLASNGYVCTDGLKYGTDLLIYTGSKECVHAKYACVVFDHQQYIHLISMQRVVNAVGKTLVIADVVGDEIVFWSVERLRRGDGGDLTHFVK